MTFGEAVEALKNGEIIRRKGRECCVKIVNGTIENTHKNVFTDKNDIWFCSADVLANDWEIVNENQQENTSEREKELIDKNAQLLNKSAETMNENYELKKALAAVIDILRLYL